MVQIRSDHTKRSAAEEVIEEEGGGGEEEDDDDDDEATATDQENNQSFECPKFRADCSVCSSIHTFHYETCQEIGERRRPKAGKEKTEVSTGRKEWREGREVVRKKGR